MLDGEWSANVYALEDNIEEHEVFNKNNYVKLLKDGKMKKIEKDINEGKNKDYQYQDGVLYKQRTKLWLVGTATMGKSLWVKFDNEFGQFESVEILELIKIAIKDNEELVEEVPHIRIKEDN